MQMNVMYVIMYVIGRYLLVQCLLFNILFPLTPITYVKQGNNNDREQNAIGKYKNKLTVGERTLKGFLSHFNLYLRRYKTIFASITTEVSIALVGCV